MASPNHLSRKKLCVYCHIEKGHSAFLKDGDLCTKCRNKTTNPHTLKSATPPIWSSAPINGSIRPHDPRSPFSNSLGSSNPDFETPPRPSISGSRNNHSTPCKPDFQPSLSNISALSPSIIMPSDPKIKELEHKIDLILEGTLELERKQMTQVSAIRSEMHKFLVDLSHMNPDSLEQVNLPVDDAKTSAVDNLSTIMLDNFTIIRTELSKLQNEVSDLKKVTSQDRESFESMSKNELHNINNFWYGKMLSEKKEMEARFAIERQEWQNQQSHFEQRLTSVLDQLRPIGSNVLLIPVSNPTLTVPIPALDGQRTHKSESTPSEQTVSMLVMDSSSSDLTSLSKIVDSTIQTPYFPSASRATSQQSLESSKPFIAHVGKTLNGSELSAPPSQNHIPVPGTGPHLGSVPCVLTQFHKDSGVLRTSNLRPPINIKPPVVRSPISHRKIVLDA
jgi:hypothetical protein